MTTRGKTPEAWADKPGKNAQKDKDARWTKKNEQNFYGNKNHVTIDRKHKLVRRYTETDAAVHDIRNLTMRCSELGHRTVLQSTPLADRVAEVGR